MVPVGVIEQMGLSHLLINSAILIHKTLDCYNYGLNIINSD